MATTTTTPAAGTKPTTTPAKPTKLAYPLAPATLQAALKAAGALLHATSLNGPKPQYTHCNACMWRFSAPQTLAHCQVPAACAKRQACLAVGALVVLARNTPATVYALGKPGQHAPVWAGNKAGATPTVPYSVAQAARAAVASNGVAAVHVPYATTRKPSGTQAPAATPAPATTGTRKATTTTPAPARPRLHSGSAGSTGAAPSGQATTTTPAPAPAPAATTTPAAAPAGAAK
jgi:hypothetical protein